MKSRRLPCRITLPPARFTRGKDPVLVATAQSEEKYQLSLPRKHWVRAGRSGRSSKEVDTCADGWASRPYPAPPAILVGRAGPARRLTAG
jgi:hypothetical protein